MSLDFAEHREYMGGDDIRLIDWRLFARTDRFYIKLFEAETAADFMVVLDISKSMSFGTHSVTKLDYARYLGSALAYFSQKQKDRVGLATFDHEVPSVHAPSAAYPPHVVASRTRAPRYAAGPAHADRRKPPSPRNHPSSVGFL